MSNITFLLPDARGSEFETPQTRVRSGTLPSGITAKMDKYSRHVAEGLSLADAYRQAFNTSKMNLITHELQPALAGDTALEGFVPRPTRGAGSWRRDRISG